MGAHRPARWFDPIRTPSLRAHGGGILDNHGRRKGVRPPTGSANLNGTTVRALLLLVLTGAAIHPTTAAEIVGITVTPHAIAPAMQYRRPRDPGLAARIQVFVKGPALPGRFNGKRPSELLADGEWAWHDLNCAVEAPKGALSVWSINGKSARWGLGQSFNLEAVGLGRRSVTIASPREWISAATFLASDGAVEPDTIVLHLANQGPDRLKVSALRLWFPKGGATWQTLWPQEPIRLSTVVPPKDKGFLKIRVPRMPLTYCALELATSAGPLWTHLRVKPEAFDISGGWVGGHVTQEPFLQLLAHLHVNTAHMGLTPGYTDTPDLYNRYPLKLFNKLDPIATFESEAWLPRVHAVEFLGEPQYGGGRPVPPQEVFDQLLPYRTSRLATSVTHSEERTWRWYAGLSDYPHYDAYRVVAPAADSWSQYDRWGGRHIRWGAPLETIGDMCRSLRELNRPMPCAYWSQGPSDGWDDWDGRKRRSPTPDELRAQALHALSTRITSLYWFNLSLKSLLRYPDTWDAITRIGREIRMLDTLYLEGDAYGFERRVRSDGSPDWDLASVAAPDAAVLFALDTSYVPDPSENVFKFGPPRSATFAFRLPSWLRHPRQVFRVDADGMHNVRWRATANGIEIKDTRSRDAIYVASRRPDMRQVLENRRQRALAEEKAHPVDRRALEEMVRGEGARPAK